MQYQSATWRIKIARQTVVEITLHGAMDDGTCVPATDVVRAASVLKEVGRAVERIADRWQKVESATKAAAVARSASEVAGQPPRV